TRLIMEPELTARAAERATAEDISALRNAVLAMERSKNNRERLDADLAFHEAIFRASGNRICHLLFVSIHRTLLMSMGHLSERVSLERPLQFYRSTLKLARKNLLARPERAVRSFPDYAQCTPLSFTPNSPKLISLTRGR